MEDAVTLWRPVGPEELKLIQDSGMRAFPPRLPEQPVFYPVLTEDYAVKIARDWNVPASGRGYVTRFRVAKSFLDKYEVHEAGGRDLREYWIPAEDLAAFNAALIGKIEIVAEFPVNSEPRTSRSIPESMDCEVVARIDAQLAAIEAEHGVRIVLAIESGSRAWGFPSPDSDYDCRFIYVRSPQDYLSLWPRRDVIEAPQDRVLDINGWDVSKAIKLLLKGNAVVIEWLTSPISYKSDGAFRSDFLELARQVADRRLIGRHYLHLGERQRRTYFRDGKLVPQKKIFYALRPAAALRWLRLHPQETVAPMHFPTLLAEAQPPKELSKLVQRLIERKAQTRELGSEPLPEPIRKFIDKEFEIARGEFEKDEPITRDGVRDLCDRFFAAVLQQRDF